MNHKDVKDRSRGDRYNAINTTLAINARRASMSRCNVRRPRIILEERFLLVPEPRRSFPLIKNNDCSFEQWRSHSWRRRNGIGTGIIIISLLSTFFFSSPLPFFVFSPRLGISRQLAHKTAHRDVQGRACHLRYLCTISDLRPSGNRRRKQTYSTPR